jgi:hypothetical protein
VVAPSIEQSTWSTTTKCNDSNLRGRILSTNKTIERENAPCLNTPWMKFDKHMNTSRPSLIAVPPLATTTHSRTSSPRTARTSSTHSARCTDVRRSGPGSCRYPIDQMERYTHDWVFFDEENSRVVFSARTHMADPGDGSSHTSTNWTMIDYAGDGRWSREEDIYNPANFGKMIGEWEAARDVASA